MTLLVIAEIAALSLWFSSSAVLPDMAREGPIGAPAQALLAAAVQAGFVVGALAIALAGWADRFDPRRLFCTCALLGAAANLALLAAPLGGALAVALRFLTGACLAGVYPVGMKIAVGWGSRDRGFLVGLLVGAVTVGSALPHLAALVGGPGWRFTLVATSLLGAAGGLAVLSAGLGPYHAHSPSFDARAIAIAWRDRAIRYAYLGYLGHMWELYAMWAWIGVALVAGYGARLPPAAAASLAKLTAFSAIAVGGVVSVLAGLAADRIGRAQVTIVAMTISAGAALATGLSLGGPVWLTLVLCLVWGASVVPDSAQFSALVVDAAPPHLAGSLLTLQTALGFALTTLTVQAAPPLAVLMGWDQVFAILALGPALGVIAMVRLLAVLGARRG